MSARHVVLGAGPIGRATVSALRALGVDSVDVVTRSGTAVPGARAVKCDVLDVRALGAAVDGAEAVHQCAAPAYHRWPEEFPPLQRAILDAVKGRAQRLVVVENLYGYGPHDGPLHERLPLAATTRKGRVRARLSEQLLEAHAAGEVQVAMLRGSDLLGPGVDASAFGARFVQGILERGRADILGRADLLHSVTYVPDFGRALALASVDARAFGRAWHVPSAEPVTVRELADRLARLAGRPSPTLRPMPRWAMPVVGLFIPAVREMAEMLYEFESPFVLDSRAFTQTFGMHATPLDEALTAVVGVARRAAA